MIELDIPGVGTYHLEHLVMDVNGTIAKDGVLSLGVAPRMIQVRNRLKVHLLTADTHGKQPAIDKALNLQATIITGGTAEKAQYVKDLGPEKTVAIGNGMNDREMCQLAAIGIAVLGGEGVATDLIHHANILVGDITDALDLLLSPNRLRATLRI